MSRFSLACVHCAAPLGTFNLLCGQDVSAALQHVLWRHPSVIVRRTATIPLYRLLRHVLVLAA
jgi:hypothetical protein